MVDTVGLLGLVGPAAISVMLIILGLLSRRLGSVTRTPRYYLGLFLSAGLMLLSAAARAWNLGRGVAPAAISQEPGWVLLYVGVPALALTLSLVVVWRYWSWLLAERG